MCIMLFVVIVTYTIHITNKTYKNGDFESQDVFKRYDKKPLIIQSGNKETIKVLYNKEVLLII